MAVANVTYDRNPLWKPEFPCAKCDCKGCVCREPDYESRGLNWQKILGKVLTYAQKKLRIE